MLRIGLYGINGHQLSAKLPQGVRAKVTAVAEYPVQRLDDALGADTPERLAVKAYASLDELLADPDVDLVSLCSPMRSEQADHAIKCLEAGKHVFAEKPAAFDSASLDRILAAAKRTGKVFRDMGGSQLTPPLQAIRRLVDNGELGTIVHVQAHKSYPWYEGRPQEIDVDGGLIRQVGIHAARFIIGATGLKITEIKGVATGLGNPGTGDIHIAAVFAATLENGGVASINLNYLNPMSFGIWGNDQLRVFGTRGMAESVDGFSRSRLYLTGREATDLPIPDDLVPEGYLEQYVNFLLDGTPMAVPFEDDLASLRTVNIAHEAAMSGECAPVR